MPRAGRDIILVWDNPASGEAPTAVGVNALAKAGVELGENVSVIRRPKGKLRKRYLCVTSIY